MQFISTLPAAGGGACYVDETNRFSLATRIQLDHLSTDKKYNSFIIIIIIIIKSVIILLNYYLLLFLLLLNEKKLYKK